jgi:N-formylglutamate amidohydrolase
MEQSFTLNKPHLFTYFAPSSHHFKGLISIPHSGETIPPGFKSFLSHDLVALGRDVDTKVHELVDIALLQENGIGVLVSHIHRVCVDLNRHKDQAILCWKQNTWGQELVTHLPSAEQIEEWILDYHQPYFEILSALTHELENSLKLNRVPVIDLHSMPSKPTPYHLKQNPHQQTSRPDFCVSDQRGKTCSPEFIRWFHDAFNESGFESKMNDPYIGGFITIFLDQFKTNNIQIEINRSLYLDESSREVVENKATHLKKKLTSILISGFEKFSQT